MSTRRFTCCLLWLMLGGCGIWRAGGRDELVSRRRLPERILVLADGTDQDRTEAGSDRFRSSDILELKAPEIAGGHLNARKAHAWTTPGGATPDGAESIRARFEQMADRSPSDVANELRLNRVAIAAHLDVAVIAPSVPVRLDLSAVRGVRVYEPRRGRTAALVTSLVLGSVLAVVATVVGILFDCCLPG